MSSLVSTHVAVVSVKAMVTVTVKVSATVVMECEEVAVGVVPDGLESVSVMSPPPPDGESVRVMLSIFVKPVVPTLTLIVTVADPAVRVLIETARSMQQYSFWVST